MFRFMLPLTIGVALFPGPSGAYEEHRKCIQSQEAIYALYDAIFAARSGFAALQAGDMKRYRKPGHQHLEAASSDFRAMKEAAESLTYSHAKICAGMVRDD